MPSFTICSSNVVCNLSFSLIFTTLLTVVFLKCVPSFSYLFLMLTHQRSSQVNFKVFSNTWTLLKISPNHTYSYVLKLLQSISQDNQTTWINAVLMTICFHLMPSTKRIFKTIVAYIISFDTWISELDEGFNFLWLP